METKGIDLGVFSPTCYYYWSAGEISPPGWKRLPHLAAELWLPGAVDEALVRCLPGIGGMMETFEPKTDDAAIENEGPDAIEKYERGRRL